MAAGSPRSIPGELRGDAKRSDSPAREGHDHQYLGKPGEVRAGPHPVAGQPGGIERKWWRLSWDEDQDAVAPT